MQLRRHSVENEEDVGEQLSVFSSWLTPRLKKGWWRKCWQNGKRRVTVYRDSPLVPAWRQRHSIFRVPCPVILSFGAGRSRSAYRVVNLRCGSCGQSRSSMLSRFDRPDRALKQLHDDVNHLVDVEVFRQRNKDVSGLLVSEEFYIVELQSGSRFSDTLASSVTFSCKCWLPDGPRTDPGWQ